MFSVDDDGTGSNTSIIQHTPPTPSHIHRQMQVATISNQEPEGRLYILHFYGHRVESQPCHLWNDLE